MALVNWSTECPHVASQKPYLPAMVQLGPSSGFSLIMHRLVSSEMRTVASKGIWNAVRMYYGGR